MEDRGGLVLKVALRVPESQQSCGGKEGADADCGPGPGGGAELRPEPGAQAAVCSEYKPFLQMEPPG